MKDIFLMQDKKVLVMKSDFYDIINQIFWSKDIVRECVILINKKCYHFNENDGCVYYVEEI